MAQPLYDEMVEYTDGTEATISQMSYDVANFLTWAAEPSMEERKSLGIIVMGFLIIFPITRKLIFGNISNKIKKKETKKNNFIDGEFEDIEDDNDRKI